MKKFVVLLLLLAPSVLAQNPTSGGPIPQTTYTTLPNNLGVPNGTTVSGSNITFPGTVSVTGGNSALYVETTGSDANNGKFGSAKLTIASALTTLGANGGVINIGCGTFNYGTALSISVINTILRGSGSGAEGTFAGCTILRPAAGVDGIDVSAQHAIIENLKIDSASTGAGADIGIHACTGAPVTNCNYVTIRDVVINKTGSFGIYLDGTGGNLVNLWRMDNVNVSSTWSGAGIKIGGGTNQNAGICVHCVSQFNAGYGFDIGTNGTGTFNNTFDGPIVIANTAGGFDIGLKSTDNTFINAYTEPGTGATMILDSGASSNTVQLPFNNVPATVTDNADNACGTGLNRISYYDGPNSALGTFGFGIAPKPGASTPVMWAMHSGCIGAGAFDLTDTVSSNQALIFSHAATNPATFSGSITSPNFASTVATGTAPLSVTSTTPVANLSIKGTTPISTYNFNQAAQSQVVVSGTEYYITRSDLDMPAVYGTAIAAGTTMRWRISLNKTAAGTGTFQILLKKGINGSTADATLVTQTIGTQTAAADNMEADIQLTWTSATAAYWTIIPRQSAASGTGFGLVYPAVAAQFNGTISGQTTTTASDKYGLSVIFTTGTPTFVVDMVQAQAFGVN